MIPVWAPHSETWCRSPQDCTLVSLALTLVTRGTPKVGWTRKHPTYVVVRTWVSRKSHNSSDTGAVMQRYYKWGCISLEEWYGMWLWSLFTFDWVQRWKQLSRVAHPLPMPQSNAEIGVLLWMKRSSSGPLVPMEGSKKEELLHRERFHNTCSEQESVLGTRWL